MGLLNGTSVYLAGAVDHAADPRKWRREITNDLLHPLGIKVYDPLIKPSWFNKHYPQVIGDDPALDFLGYKQFLDDPESISEDDQEAVWRRMGGIRELNLRCVNACDFLIINLPKQFTWGTPEEAVVAAGTGKPLFYILPDGPTTSTWLPVQAYYSYKEFCKCTFKSFEELFEHLRGIDSGDVTVDTLRWIFLEYFSDEDVINEFSNCEPVRSQPS